MTETTTCPSFTDLRAFAAATAPKGADTPAADPFASGRKVLPLRPGPVEVGAIHLPAGSGAVAALAGDWFFFAASGSASFATTGGQVELNEGASCVLGSGAGFTWQAAAPATLIYMRHTEAAPGSAALTPVALDTELQPSGAPLSELLVGETPSCRNHTQFRSADGLFTVGVWDSTPYHRRAMRYAHYELMVLLEGSVTFVDELGHEGTFAKNDVFLIEQGASCSWESRVHAAKVFAIYRPLA